MKLRWSLRTQIAIVMLIGLLFLIWQRREPWAFSKTISLVELQQNAPPYRQESPDGSRCIVKRKMWEVLDLRPGTSDKALATLQFSSRRTTGAFLTNDCIALLMDQKPDAPASEYAFAVFERRFPEWWWGHIYRLEVWFLPFMLLLVIRSIRKDRAVRA